MRGSEIIWKNGEDAEVAFADFVDRWGNDSLSRWSKELSAFARQWGWVDILAVHDRHLFERRAAALKSIVLRIAYARHRARQLADAAYPLVVLRCNDRGTEYGCGTVHGELDGLILRADDPILQHFKLPARRDCSCYLAGARDIRAAQRLGGRTEEIPPDWFKPGHLNDGNAFRVDPIFCMPNGPDTNSILALIAAGAADLD